MTHQPLVFSLLDDFFLKNDDYNNIFFINGVRRSFSVAVECRASPWRNTL